MSILLAWKGQMPTKQLKYTYFGNLEGASASKQLKVIILDPSFKALPETTQETHGRTWGRPSRDHRESWTPQMP